jgi:hypothetical protein
MTTIKYPEYYYYNFAAEINLTIQKAKREVGSGFHSERVTISGLDVVNDLDITLV